MRKSTAGNGSDSTSALQAWLAAHNQLFLADLILIGEPEYPDALWLTTWESPLCWPIFSDFNAKGIFLPASITRGKMQTSVGLQVVNTTLTYSPKNRTFSSSTNPAASTSPLQLAQLGYYDNWRVRIWRAVMPTPGDCNTFGAMEWFGGRIADATIDRGKIQWTVNSFLDVINQMVPANVVENTNPLAGYMGAQPAPGDTALAKFNVVVGSTPTVIIADCTSPSAGHIYGTNVFANGGYLVFDSGGSETLGGMYSAIAANQEFTDGAGAHHNQFTIYSAMPWAPTPGVDTFYVSAKPPVDFSDGGSNNRPFPYVPSPQAAA
jgi:hypothetical protein